MKMRLYTILVLLAFAACGKSAENGQQESMQQETVFGPILAEGWYRQDAAKLSQSIDTWLVSAHKNLPVDCSNKDIKALVVPHAGHLYSAFCAASAYATLVKWNKDGTFEKNDRINRVILLAPSHTLFFHGFCLPPFTHYQTVLGKIQVEMLTIKKMQKLPVAFVEYPQAYYKEHALEIQLPFLQKVLTNFKLVPLIVGNLSLEQISGAMETFDRVFDDQTLIIISSDFLHNGPRFSYDHFKTNILDNVRFVDSLAVQALSHKSYSQLQEALDQTRATICGQEALKVLAGMLEQSPSLAACDVAATCYYTSAHVEPFITRGADQHNIVITNLPGTLFKSLADNQCRDGVSYAGLIVYGQHGQDKTKKQGMGQPALPFLTTYEKKALMHYVRRVITHVCSHASKDVHDEDHLMYPLLSGCFVQPWGAFVTLMTKGGQLRGCIGRIMTSDPLFKTLHEMSIASALHDSRFSPVQEKELNDITIAVSLLSLPCKIKSYKDIVLGRHGIVLNKHNKKGATIASSVFLPHVPTDFGWDLETTLEQLSMKAGLARDSWKTDTAFEVFEETKLEEKDMLS